jgi:hypothetical protein
MRITAAKNEAHYQPFMNLQIARAYMAAADPAVHSRNWQHVAVEMTKSKQGVTRERWLRGRQDLGSPSTERLRRCERIRFQNQIWKAKAKN